MVRPMSAPRNLAPLRRQALIWRIVRHMSAPRNLAPLRRKITRGFVIRLINQQVVMGKITQWQKVA
jgi:hypothetical protein